MFPDVRNHPEYRSPQSQPWNEQLAAAAGKYEFTWNQDIEGKPAEDALTEKLAAVMRGKVLDVGCGHGSYTNRWADRVEEIVGFDLTAGYLETAKLAGKPNARFVQGSTKESLPFPDHYFDIAYTKKGPTSWYREGNRVVRPGGTLLLFHPGDGNGEGAELGRCFPGLFDPPAPGTPILDRIVERLEASGLRVNELKRLQETVWIPSAEDILALVCFGQRDTFAEYVRAFCYERIKAEFEKHATGRGIRTTGFYYLIEATPGRQAK
ncbi:class I SAM-dependent methyltransferase [Paenibacillus montanisoli]|uniref:SAM-dependent methyltransferase n=1 Tax=Paenibacillus montanisoli TaxID=2081970 RepID=A0A328TZN7_9BACL|nr:class I SAM-dependent methyltransferase [Paenibacillus montanisoli]RAP76008.1 SAM-dependent methyltransferase [Paenibacillus montanisoli]